VFEPESVWTLSGPDRTVFGDGALAELAGHLPAADTTLVVRDPDLPDEVVEAATSGLPGVETFADVEPDPPLATFEAALDRARDLDPDAVVGVGGGSTMDVAKVTGALAPHDGGVLAYAAEPTGGGRPVPGPGLPTAAVPTTSGTGSETTPVAVVSLPTRDLKVGVSSRHLVPDLAAVDPVATVSLPPGPTASSGLDALAHAVEAYTTRRFDAKPRATPDDRPDYGGRTPLTDALCRVAVPRVGGSLRRAVDNGADLDARREMALASHAAGRAFSNAGLGAAHAVAMAAGAAFHTPHGETVGAVLPAVVRYNRPSAPERYADVARWLGARDDEDAADAVARLARDVGVDGLADLGVEEGDVPALAERTMDLERLLAGNPRRVDREAVELICLDAL
jgi:alcohol dehydrogenase class IV